MASQETGSQPTAEAVPAKSGKSPLPFVFGSKPPIPAAEPVPSDAIPAHKLSASHVAADPSGSASTHGPGKPQGAAQKANSSNLPSVPGPFIFGQAQDTGAPAISQVQQPGTSQPMHGGISSAFSATGSAPASQETVQPGIQGRGPSGPSASPDQSKHDFPVLSAFQQDAAGTARPSASSASTARPEAGATQKANHGIGLPVFTAGVKSPKAEPASAQRRAAHARKGTPTRRPSPGELHESSPAAAQFLESQFLESQVEVLTINHKQLANSFGLLGHS